MRLRDAGCGLRPTGGRCGNERELRFDRRGTGGAADGGARGDGIAVAVGGGGGRGLRRVGMGKEGGNGFVGYRNREFGQRRARTEGGIRKEFVPRRGVEVGLEGATQGVPQVGGGRSGGQRTR